MKLNNTQKEKLSALFLDLCKIVIGVGVLGPIFTPSDKPIEGFLLAMGLVSAIISLIAGLMLCNRVED
jgi:hypothetical protein